MLNSIQNPQKFQSQVPWLFQKVHQAGHRVGHLVHQAGHRVGHLRRVLQDRSLLVSTRVQALPHLRQAQVRLQVCRPSVPSGHRQVMEPNCASGSDMMRMLGGSERPILRVPCGRMWCRG